MRRFFITGGTGLLGRALVRRLLAQKDILGIGSITLLTRDIARFETAAPDIAAAAGINLRQGNVTTLVNIASDHYTDFVHGATDVNYPHVAERLDYAWDIVSGTKQAMAFAESSGCERFLYLSSGAVYGPGPYPSKGIPEGWPTAPALEETGNAYGQAKRFCEHLCALLAGRGKIKAVRIARIFAVIGSELPVGGQYALGNFVRDALDETKDAIRIEGDGKATRSFLHVDDVAQWLIAMNDRGPSRVTYNVGSAHGVSILELAQQVAGHCGGKPVHVAGTISDYGGRSRYIPDCTLIRQALGVKEEIGFSQALAEFIESAKYGIADPAVTQ